MFQLDIKDLTTITYINSKVLLCMAFGGASRSADGAKQAANWIDRVGWWISGLMNSSLELWWPTQTYWTQAESFLCGTEGGCQRAWWSWVSLWASCSELIAQITTFFTMKVTATGSTFHFENVVFLLCVLSSTFSPAAHYIQARVYLK